MSENRRGGFFDSRCIVWKCHNVLQLSLAIVEPLVARWACPMLIDSKENVVRYLQTTEWHKLNDTTLRLHGIEQRYF